MLPIGPDTPIENDTTSESPGHLSLPVRLLIDVVDLRMCRLISFLNHIHNDGAPTEGPSRQISPGHGGESLTGVLAIGLV